MALKRIYLRGVNLWGVLIKASNAAYLAAAEKPSVRFQVKRLNLPASMSAAAKGVPICARNIIKSIRGERKKRRCLRSGDIKAK